MLRTALRFIRYDKAKSIGVTIGIVISTFLIGQQVGIFTFLTGLMSGLTDHTDSEVWIVDKKAINANALGQLDTRVIAEARSIVGRETCRTDGDRASHGDFRRWYDGDGGSDWFRSTYIWSGTQIE
ncbi:MAG: hypothetical protein RLZZ519_2383 [Bacteroidota bacterium]|jgi:hypothetical protein